MRGRDPVNELLVRSKFLRAVMLPSSAGMVPERLEEARLRVESFLRRLKFVGIVPPIPVPEKSLTQPISFFSSKLSRMKNEQSDKDRQVAQNRGDAASETVTTENQVRQVCHSTDGRRNRSR